MTARTARAPGRTAARGPARDAARDRRRTVATGEGLALSVTIASRSSRVGALLIDLAIQVVILIGGMLALLAIGINSEFHGSSVGSTGAGVPLMLFLFAVHYGYFLGFELGPRGATPGKRALGIRVAARPGSGSHVLTAEAVVARNLVRDIELFLPIAFALSMDGDAAGWASLGWFAAILAIPFTNRDALRAGDLIAGTWVVEAPRTRLAAALSAAEPAADAPVPAYRFGPAELEIYGEYELQTLERVLRDGDPVTLARVQETICGKIGWEAGGDARPFLDAFYASLRAHLERDMRFGRRKADKFG